MTDVSGDQTTIDRAQDRRSSAGVVSGSEKPRTPLNTDIDFSIKTSNIPKAVREEDPPKQWPVWALKMRAQYEHEIHELKTKLSEMENAALSTHKAQQQDKQNSALALYGDSEDVKGLTKRLNVLLPNAGEIGTAGVALVAQIAIAHGLDPLPGSDHIYPWTQGNKLIVTIGYKGLLHLARKQLEFTYQSRPMNEEERAEHGVNEFDKGYVTTLYEIAKAVECQRAGIPYFPVIGTSVWKKGEKFPTSKSPAWVAKKNSLKDALRQVTSTGIRLQNALDVQFDADAGEWQAPLPADPIDVQAVIEAGIVPPDDDGLDVIDGEIIEHQPEPAAEQPQEPPAVNKSAELDPYDPAKDERALNKETCRELADWMARNMHGVDSLPHATNAIKLALVEAGRVAMSETWPTVYGKSLTVAQTYAAVQTHYEKKSAE